MRRRTDGASTGEPTDGVERRSPSVLVVDDEPQIADLLCLVLEDEGFYAIRAYDGAQAWEVLAASPDPPDLVISDVRMPQMNGVQLVRRLKEVHNGTCPPVILMSAAGEVGPAPGVRFLAKPFDLDRMLDLVS